MSFISSTSGICEQGCDVVKLAAAGYFSSGYTVSHDVQVCPSLDEGANDLQVTRKTSDMQRDETSFIRLVQICSVPGEQSYRFELAY